MFGGLFFPIFSFLQLKTTVFSIPVCSVVKLYFKSTRSSHRESHLQWKWPFKGKGHLPPSLPCLLRRKACFPSLVLFSSIPIDKFLSANSRSDQTTGLNFPFPF